MRARYNRPPDHAARRLPSSVVLTWHTPKYTGPERRKRPRWRPRPFRVLFILLALAAAGYIIAVLWLVVQESRIVVQAGSAPASTPPPFPYEEVSLDGAGGPIAWIIPPGAEAAGTWVLYLHGNATNIGSHVNVAHYQLLTGLGLHVLAPEYRGFGGQDGTPTESSLREDALRAYRYLREARGASAERIVVYGWSLGAFLAVDLAAREPAAAVVLEAPAASLAGLAQQRYPFFPLRLLMPNRFEAIARIGHVQVPILFLHSPDDDVIPMWSSRELYAAARSDTTFVEARGGHFDAVDVDADRLANAVGQFLAAHRIPFAGNHRPTP